MDTLISQDEIISAIKDGSEIMHKYLYDTFRKKGLAYIILMNKDVAALDIYMDSMVDLFKLIKRGKTFNKSIEAYLMGIIRNKVLKVLSDKNWNIISFAKPIDTMEIEEVLDENLEKKLMEIVRDIVEKLEPKCKKCLLLRHYENMRIDEIALIMGLAYNTVKGDLPGCRRKLRALVLADPRVIELLS